MRIILYHFTEKESVKRLKWKVFGHPLAMKVVLPLIYLKKNESLSGIDYRRNNESRLLFLRAKISCIP